MTDTLPLALVLRSPKTDKPMIFEGEYHAGARVLVLSDEEAATYAEHFAAIEVTHTDGTPYRVCGASALASLDGPAASA